MGFALIRERNRDLDAAAANLPNFRLITIPSVLYGRYLPQILGVPVRLVDNVWGGSAAEAGCDVKPSKNDPIRTTDGEYPEARSGARCSSVARWRAGPR